MKMIKYYVSVFCLCSAAITFAQPAYKNKNLSPDVRAKHLLSLMTVDEKVMQTQCLWIQKSRILNAQGDFDEAKAKDALKNGLGELGRLNENLGPNSYGYHPKQAAELYNKIQKYFVEKTSRVTILSCMLRSDQIRSDQIRC